MSNQKRRVRALKKVYVGNVFHTEGAEFVYDGPANANLFLELEAGDTTPVTSNVPRAETSAEPEIDDVL